MTKNRQTHVKDITTDSEMFANLIINAREREDISQRKLAEEVGCSNSTLARWERGIVSSCDIRYLYKVSEILKIDFFIALSTLLPAIKADYKEEMEVINIVRNIPKENRDIIMTVIKSLSMYFKVN